MIDLEAARRRGAVVDGSTSAATCDSLLDRLVLWLADVSAEAIVAAPVPGNHPAMGAGAHDRKPARRGETP